MEFQEKFCVRCLGGLNLDKLECRCGYVPDDLGERKRLTKIKNELRAIAGMPPLGEPHHQPVAPRAIKPIHPSAGDIETAKCYAEKYPDLPGDRDARTPSGHLITRPGNRVQNTLYGAPGGPESPPTAPERAKPTAIKGDHYPGSSRLF